jgi:ketosteroid isomerase-like protein
MALENVEIIEGMLEAAERGDWDTTMAAYDPAVELDQSRFPDGGIYSGREGVRKFFEEWFGAWEELRVESQGVVAVPDGRVISLIRISGRGKESGVEVTMEAADVFTLRDGKVIQMTGYPERAEALEAVGLSEQNAHADP